MSLSGKSSTYPTLIIPSIQYQAKHRSPAFRCIFRTWPSWIGLVQLCMRNWKILNNSWWQACLLCSEPIGSIGEHGIQVDPRIDHFSNLRSQPPISPLFVYFGFDIRRGYWMRGRISRVPRSCHRHLTCLPWLIWLSSQGYHWVRIITRGIY